MTKTVSAAQVNEILEILANTSALVNYLIEKTDGTESDFSVAEMCQPVRAGMPWSEMRQIVADCLRLCAGILENPS